ncbi:MAG TPA: sulfite exporter TauE/SafE family protein [Victivallales bacterium]|nr:sulfite exporter TauE/SafE family protein [Victivallales bacterium]
MDASIICLILSIIFLGSIVRSTFGFGNALITMPLMSLIIGLQTAAPISALISTTIALVILINSWQFVNLKSVWRLVVSSAVGIPVGIFILTTMNNKILVIILAIFLILFSLYRLLVTKTIKIKSNKPAYLFGLLAGVFGGAYNINGPFIVVYSTLKNWSPVEFRATLQGYFFLANLLIIFMQGASGLWTGKVFLIYLLALPVVGIAIYIGGKFTLLIPKGKFDKVIYIFLILIGLFLLIQN